MSTSLDDDDREQHHCKEAQEKKNAEGKNCKVICHKCGFEKRRRSNNNNNNDYDGDEFPCDGCQATKLWLEKDVPEIRKNHPHRAFYRTCTDRDECYYFTNSCKCVKRYGCNLPSDSDLPGIYKLVLMQGHIHPRHRVLDAIYKNYTVKGFLKIQSFTHDDKKLIKGKVVFTNKHCFSKRSEGDFDEYFENGFTFVHTEPDRLNKRGLRCHFRGEIQDGAKEYISQLESNEEK